MYVPAFPGLSPLDFVGARRAPVFPFGAKRVTYGYRARHAIYHLFRRLASMGSPVQILAPDFHSGNEILAMRAAGANVEYCRVGSNLQMNPDDVARLCSAHRPDVVY